MRKYEIKLSTIVVGRGRERGAVYLRNDSSSLMYSPTSAWWKHTTPIGSMLLHSVVDFAATPNPCIAITLIDTDTYIDRKVRSSDVNDVF